MILQTSFPTDGQISMLDRPDQPNPFARWLRAAMLARALGVRQLAYLSKVNKSSISSYLRGENYPDLESLEKLARYFGVSRKELLALTPLRSYTDEIPSSTLLSEATGVVLVPVVEQEAGAGGGVEVLDYEYIHPTITAKHKSIVAVRVRGDCMSPKVEDGDIVIVDRERGWEDGRVVLARVDDKLLIKRAYRQNSHVRLHADNPLYTDIHVPEPDILGVVIRVIKTI